MEREQTREDYRVKLERWRIQVLPHQIAANNWTEISSQFGHTIARYTLILNGGALIALPPFMEWAGQPAKPALICASAFFVVGLLCGVVTLVCAYYNFLFLSQVESAREQMGALKLNHSELVDTGNVNQIPGYEGWEDKEENANSNVERSQRLTVVFVFLSVSLFLIGVFAFSELAMVSDDEEQIVFINSQAVDLYVTQSSETFFRK